MAENGGKPPLFSGLLDDPKSQSNAVKRKNFSCFKSASQTESILDHKPKPNFKKIVTLFSTYLSIGSFIFHLVRDQMKGTKTNGVLDSVYFCVVTMTTVGYGDLVPNTVTTKLLSCGYVFTGMTIVGVFLSGGADYLAEKQQVLMVKAFRVCQSADPADIEKEIVTKRVKYKCFIVLVVLALIMILGTVILVTVEKLGVVDAFYCVCTTITTLGYGDVSFGTKSGRIFAIFWILTGTGSLAQFFFYVAELRAESRQRELVRWVVSKKMTTQDLEAADLDKDKNVELAEFIIFKLKEMGKIDQEDISLLEKEFEDLDVNKNKRLSPSEISTPAQTGR